MFWRLLLVVCGLTFFVSGCNILTNEDCNSVDIGGTHRAISYSCHRSPNAGEMSGTGAGGLAVVVGLGMILLAVWPAIQNLSENRRSSASYRSLPPTYVPRPSPAPTRVPTPQADAVPVAQPEPAALEPEVVEPSEVAADVTGESPARDAGPNEMKEPMVDDDPELERLQEALVAAEQKIEQRLEERREAEEQRLEEGRQAEEAENRKAETAKRISELASRLEEAEAKLSELDAPDSQEPTKALQKRCRCNTLVDVSSATCPNCTANMANQFQTTAVWRCRRCEHVVGEHDGSCSNCEAVLYG